MCRLEAQTVKAAAKGRWEFIFNSLAPQLSEAMGCSPRHARECPIPSHRSRGDGHGRYKFRLPQGWQDYGNAICTCGSWGDGFSLLQALNGWSFGETVEKVGGVIGMVEDAVRVISTDTSKNRKVQGKIFFLGFRTELFRGVERKVYTVKLRLADGSYESFGGALLKKACELAGISRGDNAQIALIGIQTCEGKKGTFLRKSFAVSRLPSDEEVAQAKKEQEEQAERILKATSALWNSSVSVTEKDSAAAAEVREYFKGRRLDGLEKSFTGDLRAAKLAYKGAEGVTPYFGLVAAVRDLEGNLVCLHRTFLDKGKKADVGTPKKLTPVAPGQSISGCAIHLGEPAADGVLCLAEGIETAASVVAGTGYPCWSCVSANGLKSVKVPDSVKLVFIFEDKDASGTGQAAANALRARLQAEGKIAVVCSISDPIPSGSHGLDWNDILRMSDGLSRFPVRKP